MRAVFLPLLFFPLLHFHDSSRGPPPWSLGSVFFFFCSFFFLVSRKVSSHLPFAQLSLTSPSSTPLHYEIQLIITPGKSFLFYMTRSNALYLHYNLLIHLLNACFTLHVNMHRLSLSLAPWWKKGGGDDLVLSPSRVYLLSSPGFAKRSTTAVATSNEIGSLQLAASAARPKPFSFTGRAKG